MFLVRAISSFGRARPWHGRGDRFDPGMVHRVCVSIYYMNEPLKISQSGDLVLIALAGDFTKDKVDALKQNVLEGEKLIASLFANRGHKINVLLDLTGFTGTYDAEAMEVMADFAAQNKKYVRKTAAFGGSEKAKVLGEIVFAMADRENVGFFAAVGEAEEYLAF